MRSFTHVEGDGVVDEAERRARSLHRLPITEEFKGDTRVFTFYQLGLAKPKIVFTKRKSVRTE